MIQRIGYIYIVITVYCQSTRRVKLRGIGLSIFIASRSRSCEGIYFSILNFTDDMIVGITDIDNAFTVSSGIRRMIKQGLCTLPIDISFCTLSSHCLQLTITPLADSTASGLYDNEIIAARYSSQSPWLFKREYSVRRDILIYTPLNVAAYGLYCLCGNNARWYCTYEHKSTNDGDEFLFHYVCSPLEGYCAFKITKII
ncbi:hypothetical protein D3C71_1321330 [compost metagenome]